MLIKTTECYLKMMDEINVYYPRSLLRWVNVFHRDKDRMLQELEDTINKVWEDCLCGDAKLLEFLKALKEYKKYMGQLIRLYQNRHKVR